MKRIFSVLLSLLLVLMCFGCSNTKTNNIELNKVFDYVYDIGTITSLDSEYANDYLYKEYNNWGGGCSAVAKVLDNGDTIVGRNMDLNISNKAAYIFRTDVEGCYKTINLIYTFRDISPDLKDLETNGLPEHFYKVMPFIPDDVLNEKGLFIEVNMRNAEFWPTGQAKFSCEGTNPSSDTTIYSFEVSRYVGDHCATVDEALEYLNTLNIYTKYGYWNYCFLMADSTGHYGVLEIADNKLIWNDYAPAQTNFYLNEELQSQQELGIGQGRYKLLMDGIDEVKNEDDMYQLMDSVSYFQYYDIENCKYDYLYEVIGLRPYITQSYVEDKNNKEFIDSSLIEIDKYINSLSRQELQDLNTYWESSFTEVVNCNNKTLKVRFFEDDNKFITLSFD